MHYRALAAFIACAVVASPAFADTAYEVTATDGASNFNEAQCFYGNLEGAVDGVTPIDLADALADSELSLTEAICLANHDGQPSVIDLAVPDVNFSTGMTSAFYGVNHLPIVRSSITIVGHGATLRASYARFFFVAGPFHGLGAGDLTLVDLTLRGGRVEGESATWTGAGAGLGGAIYNQGTLTRSRSPSTCSTATPSPTTIATSSRRARPSSSTPPPAPPSTTASSRTARSRPPPPTSR